MESILSFINDYGLFAITLFIFLEYACFPVSSEILLPFSGAAAAASKTPFSLLLLLSVAAGILGTTLCYFLGRLGTTFLPDPIRNHFPKTKKALDSSRKAFEKYGTAAVCIGRIIPLIRTWIALIAGLSGLSYHRFFFFSLLGITAWNTLLLGAGYLLNSQWAQIASFYEDYKKFFMALIFFLLFLLLIRQIHCIYLRLSRKKP